MVELRNIAAGYPGRPVLEDVSLSFVPGQVTVLLGPNGCGKSTLLHTANGLLPVTKGEVWLDGRPLNAYTPKEIARKVAVLPQSRPVPEITARRMVLHGRFPWLSYPRRYREEDHAAVRQALAWVGAEDLAERPLSSLSGGQRQKIYIALALAPGTETVLDEPTTFLDAKHQLEVMALARALAREGKAVGLVLHDLCLALPGADRVALLYGGRLEALGEPEEIWRSGCLERVLGVRLGRVETEAGWRYYLV